MLTREKGKAGDPKGKTMTITMRAESRLADPSGSCYWEHVLEHITAHGGVPWGFN